jgi:hypothetical protein
MIYRYNRWNINVYLFPCNVESIVDQKKRRSRIASSVIKLTKQKLVEWDLEKKCCYSSKGPSMYLAMLILMILHFCIRFIFLAGPGVA